MAQGKSLWRSTRTAVFSNSHACVSALSSSARAPLPRAANITSQQAASTILRGVGMESSLLATPRGVGRILADADGLCVFDRDRRDRRGRGDFRRRGQLDSHTVTARALGF